MKLQAVLFDMDGVLTDSVPLHYRAWHSMFTAHGYAFDQETYREKVDGKPRLTGIRSVAPEASPEQLERMAAEKQALFLEAAASGAVETFRDAFELLDALKAAGIKAAVASSSRNAGTLLQKLGVYERFDAVVTGNDITTGKPDPEIFLKAAAELGVPPDRAVVLEDAIEGVRAGLAAGMLTIGVARHGNEAQLSHAHLVLRGLGELTVEGLERLLQERK